MDGSYSSFGVQFAILIGVVLRLFAAWCMVLPCSIG